MRTEVRGQGSGIEKVWRRCAACGRLALCGELCAICMRGAEAIAAAHRLGVRRRSGATPEARRLDRWLRRREWMARLRRLCRGVGKLLEIPVYIFTCWALAYLVCKFGEMFLAWARGGF